MPILYRRTRGGGRVSIGLLHACLAAQTQIKACPRLQYTAVQFRSLRVRGAGGTQCADTWAHARARARAHSHTLTPQITSGMEKAATDWPAEPSLSLRGQGNFSRLFPSPHPPPPPFNLMVKQQQSSES
ncbi:hypothetical protein mRhiFer1_008681 [Rhinolophus ferrumequinum]|uniref:Uncharacterized protein n=1 Tax=Rhinolophus ferrumequinum TaxID=59479 RepID=A0A7J7TQZ4_RHIFE|nr:hypothetical protein mRhiFer1_008681 [Rhinolophus ferrumequinum]